MNNSVNHKDDSTRIDLISFDLRSEGREVAFTSCFDNEEKQYEINSFVSNNSDFDNEQSNCYICLRGCKSVDKLVASIGEVLTYKIIIDNLGSIPAYNIILQDNIPAGTTYIINSLRMNGYIQSGAYPQLGFCIPRINPESRVIITFEVSINFAKPVPTIIGDFSTIIINDKEAINTNIVNTEITACYCDEENFCEEGICGDKEPEFKCSFEVERRGLDLTKCCVESELEELEKSYLNIKITKVANKDCVGFNDIITYRIRVKNKERLNLFNIQLVDSRDSALEFIKDTLYFNGQKVKTCYLDEFLNIGDLQVSEECIIEYQMRVISTTKDGYLRNSIYAKCCYSPNQEDLIEGVSRTIESKTKVRAMNFNTFSFNRTVELEECRKGKITIEDIDAEVIIDNQYVFEGICLKDNEGNISSGNQLKIFGYIDVLIQYAIMNSCVEIRLKTWRLAFTSYIMLPPDYEEGDNIDISYNIEYSAADILSLRELNLASSILFYI